MSHNAALDQQGLDHDDPFFKNRPRKRCTQRHWLGLSLALLADGWQVFLASRRADALQATPQAAKVAGQPGQAHVCVADWDVRQRSKSSMA